AVAEHAVVGARRARRIEAVVGRFVAALRAFGAAAAGIARPGAAACAVTELAAVAELAVVGARRARQIEAVVSRLVAALRTFGAAAAGIVAADAGAAAVAGVGLRTEQAVDARRAVGISAGAIVEGLVARVVAR